MVKRLVHIRDKGWSEKKQHMAKSMVLHFLGLGLQCCHCKDTATWPIS